MKRPVVVTLPGLMLPVVPSAPKPARKPLSARGRTRKGRRVELDISSLHEPLRIIARRVPGSGNRAGPLGASFAGDIKIWLHDDEQPIVGEVKARAQGAGFRTLEKWIGDLDIIFLRRDGADPFIAMPLTTYQRLLRRRT